MSRAKNPSIAVLKRASGSQRIGYHGETVETGLDSRPINVTSIAQMKAYDAEAGQQFSLAMQECSGPFLVKTGSPPSDPGEGVFIILNNGNYAERQYGQNAMAEKMVKASWWGVVADWDGATGTDNAARAQAAIDFVEQQGGALVLGPGDTRITQGLTVSKAITIIANGTRLIYDANTGVALTVAAPSGSLLLRPRILGHLVVEKTTIDWASNTHGVKVQNCYSGEFHLSVLKFTRGIWLRGDETGCVYNDFHISQLTNNQRSTYLDVATATGWCNQNTFWGGRYSNGVAGAGSHITIDDSLYDLNGNSWVRPSLEAISDTFELFNLQGGQNSILFPRCEHGGSPAFYGELGGIKNEINAHSSPYLTQGRVNITGIRYKLVTSVGSVTEDQMGRTFRTVGGNAPIKAHNVDDSAGHGLEILNASGTLGVGIPATGPWEVYNGKKVLWRTTQAPTTGSWTRGDVAYQTNPSAGGNVGWVCITSGSPGVWKAFGTIEA